MWRSPLSDPSGELLPILLSHVVPLLSLTELQALAAANYSLRTALKHLVLEQLKKTAGQRLPGLQAVFHGARPAFISQSLYSHSSAVRNLLAGQYVIQQGLNKQQRLSLSPSGQLAATIHTGSEQAGFCAVHIWQLDLQCFQLKVIAVLENTLQPWRTFPPLQEARCACGSLRRAV